MPPATDRYILAAYAKTRGSRSAYAALCALEARVAAGPVPHDEIVQETDRIVATLTPPEDTPDAHD